MRHNKLIKHDDRLSFDEIRDVSIIVDPSGVVRSSRLLGAPPRDHSVFEVALEEIKRELPDKSLDDRQLPVGGDPLGDQVIVDGGVPHEALIGGLGLALALALAGVGQVVGE